MNFDSCEDSDDSIKNNKEMLEDNEVLKLEKLCGNK